MSPRKLRLRRTDQRVALAIGVLAGVGLAIRGASPTGSTVTDWIVLVLATTAGVWASASAPWWALSALTAIAAAIAEPIVPTLIGLGLFGLSLAVGATRRSQPLERAAIAGGAMLVLSFAQELGWFGVNSAIALAAVVGTAALGLRRRSRRDRRVAVAVLGGVAAVAVIAGLALVAAGSSARPHMSEGNRVARQGLSQLKAGEFDRARESFGRAADSFERADADLGAVWAQPARLVPIASQHRRAGATLSSAAASSTRKIERQLVRIDFDRLRIVDGRIDIDAIRDLQAPMNELQAALDELDRGAMAAYDDWLIDPLQDRIVDLRADIAEQRELGEKANEALAFAPAALGAEGERVYFVMFTTPAEARGTGGFMGNYAEISIDDGRIAMTAFGRHSDLNQAAGGDLVLHDPPEDWLARYGAEGFATGPERRVDDDAWSIINLSPHFPYTAGVIADLYPQSGGREIDGVISLDVYALEALIGLVGPIPIEDGTRMLNGTNAAKYLLIDQYEFEDLDANAERIDQLEVVATEVTDRLLSTNPPLPLDLGKAMAPMARERRMIAWLSDEREQRLVESVALDGALLRDREGRDGLAVVAVNDGGNKLDVYLGREIRYLETADGGRVEVTVTHAAPVDRLPAYAVGRTSDLPTGWSRVWLTLNSTRPVSTAQLDGAAVGVSATEEAGVWNYSLLLNMAPGTSQTLSFDLIGPPSEAGVMIQPQPLVEPERWHVGSDEVGAVAERTFVPRR